MQPSNFIVSNLTINVRDCESCAPFIKKQTTNFRQSHKNETKRRERSVEMYDEGVYAEDVYTELEQIGWDTLVRNTAEFHCVFAPQKPPETFEEYMANKYTEVEEDECEIDEDAMNVRLANNPYHQEMLDEYAAIVAKVCADIAKERENGVERKEYTCCTGCRNSNGARPFHFCKRSYAANFASDNYEDDNYEDDNYEDDE